MATRFYLSANSGGNAISPTPDSNWEVTTSISRRVCSPVKDGSTIASKTSPNTGASAIRDVLNAQFISALPLKAQTISGNITAQIRGNISSTTSRSGAMSMSARVISPGGTVRGTLYTSLGTGVGSNFTTTLTNRSLASTAMSSVTAQDGDYLVIEVGWTYLTGTNTTTNAVQSFGSSSGTDLPVNETTTTANNPWVELSGTLDFFISPAFTGTGTLSVALGLVKTRYYLSSSTVAATSPAFASGWNITTGADRMAMSTTKDGSSFADKDSGHPSGSLPKVLIRQFVSDQIAAQTISCGISWWHMAKSTSLFVSQGYIIIRVVDAAGTTVRGTLLDDRAKTFNTDSSFAERGGNGYTSSSVTAQNGDRIVVEIGESVFTVNGTDVFTSEFGSAGASDLPGDFSGSTGQNAYVDFFQVIAPYVSYVPAFSGTGTMAVTMTAPTALAPAFSGTGTFVAPIFSALLMSPAFTGSGSLASTIDWPSFISVALSGNGSLSGVLDAPAYITGAASGSGSLSAAIDWFAQLSASMQGSGTLAAVLDIISSAWDTAFSGTGTMSVSLSAPTYLTVGLQGSGSLASTLDALAYLQPAMTGAGNMNATVSYIAYMQTGFAGNTTFTVLLGDYRYITPAFSGSATMDTTMSAPTYVQAGFTGTSALDVSMSVYAFITAAMQGQGSMTAPVDLLLLIQAAMSGSGAVTATLDLPTYITATVNGNGAFAVVLGYSVNRVKVYYMSRVNKSVSKDSLVNVKTNHISGIVTGVSGDSIIHTKTDLISLIDG